MLPWWLVRAVADGCRPDPVGRMPDAAWPAPVSLRRGNPRTTADNRALTAALIQTEQWLCSDSADSGAGLLDGTRLPTF
jgi:hypothetical protein